MMRGRGMKVGVTLVVLLLTGILSAPTWSAFSGTTANPGNTFAAGTVELQDDDSGTAMFSMNMGPGDSVSKCITVRYIGSLDAHVRLYGTTTGSGLDAELQLTVTRGTAADPYSSCAGFTEDASDYLGLGAGVIFSGTLRDWADSQPTGLDDPWAGAGETWTTGEEHGYRFTVGLPAEATNGAGLNATQSFTWEARDLSAAAPAGRWQHPWPSALNHDTSQGAQKLSAAVIAGTPWITWVEWDGTNDEVRVAKLNGAGTAWTEVVGGASPINHDPGRAGDDPSLAEIGGVPHITWVEWDGTNDEVRVAKLNGAGTAWTEVVGGASPINHSATKNAEHPHLADVGGVSWVVWRETGTVGRQVRVSKLNGAGTAWAQVASGSAALNLNPTGHAYNPSIAVLDGVPYVAWTEPDAIEGNHEVRVAKLNATGDGWTQTGTAPSPVNHDQYDAEDAGLAVHQGALHVVWREGDGANTEVRVSRLNAAGTVWSEVVGGANPLNLDDQTDGEFPVIAAGGGALYVAWTEHDGTNREVRVARLNGAGTAWEQVIVGANPINVSATKHAYWPALVVVGGIPVVAWAEDPGSFEYQVRTARP
jgi:hypothetical protein